MKKIKTLFLAIPFILCSCGEKEVNKLVKKISTYEADGTLTGDQEFTYDDQGRELTIVENYYENSKVDSTYSVEIFYSGEFEMYNVDKHYNPETKTWEKMDTTYFTYDENNCKICRNSISYRNNKESSHSISFYRYDENKNLISAESFIPDDDSLILFSRTTYEYNDKNLLVEETMFTAYEGSLDFGGKMVYSYNDKNELIKKEEYYSDEDEALGFTTYTYDASCNTEMFYEILDDDSEKLKVKNEYLLDADGRVTKHNYYCLDDEGKQLQLDYYEIYEY